MKNKLKIVMTMTIAIIASQVFGQVRIVNSATNSAAINGSAFIDASSNSTTNPTNNIGKGLLFPRTDLTTFSAFSGTPVGLGSSYPTRFDGMIVYNTGTGSTLASASDSIVSVTPGFYYYDNKTTNLKGGKWTRMDATATDISKLLVQSPAKDSIMSVVSSNGKTLSNGNGILINGGNSLAKSVLADASLRIDSTAIAKMVGQSPVKDSIAKLVTSSPVKDSIIKTITSGSGRDSIIKLITSSPAKDSIYSSVMSQSKTIKVGSKLITLNSADSVQKAVLSNVTVDINTSALKDSTSKWIGQSPIKDSLTKTISTSVTQSPVKDSILSLISSNGKTLSNGNGILINGSNSLAKSVLADASLRIDSTVIAKMIGQSPVKDSIAKLVTSSPVKDSIIKTIVNNSTFKDSIIKTMTSSPGRDSIIKMMTSSPVKDSIYSSVVSQSKTIKAGSKLITLNSADSVQKAVLSNVTVDINTSALKDSTSKWIGQSPIKDSLTKTISTSVTQSPVKDSILSLISSNGKTLSNGNGILINGSNSLAKSVLADASLRIDSTAIAKMVGESPVKDSIAKLVTSSPVKDSIIKTMTSGSGRDSIIKLVTSSPVKDSIYSSVVSNSRTIKAGSKLITLNSADSVQKAVLSNVTVDINTSALKDSTSKWIGQSPIKDSLTKTISTSVTQSPVKDSILSLISSNGKTLSNGNGILINGSNSLAKSVLADASLRIDSTAIAKMVGQSPVKDSIAKLMTSSPVKDSIIKTITSGSGRDSIIKLVTSSPAKDSIYNNVVSQSKTIKAGSKLITLNSADSVQKAVLSNVTVDINTSALKDSTSKWIGQSPIKDSLTKTISTSVTQSPVKDSILSLISSNGKTLSNGNGILINGSNSLAKSVLADASLRIDSTAIAKMIGQSPVKDSIAKLVTSSPVKDSIASLEPWYNVLTGKGATKNTDSIYTMGRVGIGTSTPDKSAILDISSTNKGVLLPRINLTSATMQLGSSSNAVGLLVFNSGTVLSTGYYFWNGTEWRTIDNSTAVAPTISSINCPSADLNPASYSAGTAYTGTLSVPYTGGNGGTYTGGDSITVNGLKFKLQGGKLVNGSGNFIFNVTGTPTVSTPSATNITMNSSLIPFYTGSACTVTVGNNVSGSIKSVASIGSPTLSTDNGVTGYGVSVTSPDGLFSVRGFIVSNNYDGSAASFGTDAQTGINLQIRYNGSTDTAIAGQFNYFAGGVGGAAFNNLYLKAGVWCGGDEYTATTRYASFLSGTAGAGSQCNSGASFTACRFVSLGNAGVQSGGVPERREYSWTINNGAVKTAYSIRFSSSSKNPNQLANTTNCPSGTCTGHKMFLVLEQVSGN